MEKKIENIKEVLKKIELNKITLLTGSNGSGKSLIRQQLKFGLSKKYNLNPSHLTVDVSMAKRTGVNPELGALASFMHDDPDKPTSLCTYENIDMLLHSFIDNKENTDKYYLIFDEPEIGMTKETQLGLSLYLKEKFSLIKEYTYGLLIISNSEFLVNELKEDIDVFLNMDGYKTIYGWLNREITPTNFENLTKDSNELFHYLIKSKRRK